MRNWLTWLWKLRSPKICCLKAGDPGKPVVKSNLNPRRPEGQRSAWCKPLSKGRRRQMSQLEQSGRKQKAWISPSSTSLFYLDFQWVGWCLSTLRELFYWVHWFRRWSHLSLTDIPSNNVESGHPLAQSSWHKKLTSQYPSGWSYVLWTHHYTVWKIKTHHNNTKMVITYKKWKKAGHKFYAWVQLFFKAKLRNRKKKKNKNQVLHNFSITYGWVTKWVTMWEVLIPEDLKCYLFLKINLFSYLFLAALGFRCCVRAFSRCGEQGLLFMAVRGLLIVVASLAAEHGL